MVHLGKRYRYTRVDSEGVPELVQEVERLGGLCMYRVHLFSGLRFELDMYTLQEFSLHNYRRWDYEMELLAAEAWFMEHYAAYAPQLLRRADVTQRGMASPR